MIQLLVLILVLALIVFPVWAIIRILSLGTENNAIAQKLSELESDFKRLREKVAAGAKPLESTREPAASPAMPLASRLEPVVSKPLETQPPLIAPECEEIAFPPSSEPPPVLAFTTESKQPAQPFPDDGKWEPEPSASFHEETPPPSDGGDSYSQRAETFFANIDWEQFMGAKLFAWLGGFAAFLGAAFFVKYSFEHELIPPELRVALGFLFSIGLVIGGLKIDRARYAVTVQTLCATGVVSLYAVTFACNAVYHFAFFGVIPTFLLMALITAVAFLLAVRLDARVVAILGILGGFLTPVLLSTGHDNPAGLFGYLALLNVGLVAVALHRRWHFLVPLGAVGTVAMQIGWAGKFFEQNPDEKAGVAVVVCLAFSALFLAACAFARRRGLSSRELTWSAVALPCVCYGFALFFLGYPNVGGRVGLIFSFVLLADLCLLALAWLEGLRVLVGIAAAGSIVLQMAWAARILTAERAPAAMAMCLGFCALFFAAYVVARRLNRSAPEITWSAVAMPFVAFLLAFALLGYSAVAARPGLLLSFVLLADIILLVLAWLDVALPKLHLVAGIAVFALLAAWTTGRLTTELLPWALAFTLLYAVLHTAFPLVLERHRPAAAPVWWSQIFPPLALLLMLAPLFKLEAVSLLFWPCVLLVDLIAIALALVTASIAVVAIVLVLTLVATGLWIFQVPVTIDAEPGLVLVIGGFAVLFFAAGMFLVRKLGDRLAPAKESLAGIFGDARTQIPAFSSLMPFLLLIMMTQRLPLLNPSPVFGLALLLLVLTLGFTVILMRTAGPFGAPDSGESRLGVSSDRSAGIEWLPACGLAGIAGLEYAWHERRFVVENAGIALSWYLLFAAVFAIYPFIFRRRFAAVTGPWAVAALAGVCQFPLVYRLIQTTWPNHVLGVLPALFALPPTISLVLVLRASVASERARLNQLAWFGGIALLFITLIFPIQFERQWLTLGWALEGAALLWLFHRVPHPGLRATGAVLLVTAFARLALNPAVLHYHVRSTTPVLNWYFYSYGLVIACLFVGARLVAPPRERVLGVNTPPLLNSLGTILAFLLLNIEIADFFSEPGAAVLTFEFSGNFGRDMTCTIAWALFALALLLVCIARQLRSGRYAALALLGVALLKLFFHDLARLEALYRVGALFAVAVIAIVASFAYQRFLPGNEKNIPKDS
ncbi:MAG: DUF2339 domain-containing protein [Opitutaceae bacterium]|jgi:uncharacterized membrane protein